MGGTRYRQKLGNALKECEHDGLEEVQGGSGSR
jgi:hypothetical protein